MGIELPDRTIGVTEADRRLDVCERGGSGSREDVARERVGVSDMTALLPLPL